MLFKSKEQRIFRTSLVGSPELLGLAVLESIKRFGKDSKITITFKDADYDIKKSVHIYNLNNNIDILASSNSRSICTADLILIEGIYKLTDEEEHLLKISNDDSGVEFVNIPPTNVFFKASSVGKVRDLTTGENLKSLNFNYLEDLMEQSKLVDSNTVLVYDEEFKVSSKEDLGELIKKSNRLRGTKRFSVLNTTNSNTSLSNTKNDLEKMFLNEDYFNYVGNAGVAFINLLTDAPNDTHLFIAYVTYKINVTTGWMMSARERSKLKK